MHVFGIFVHRNQHIMWEVKSKIVPITNPYLFVRIVQIVMWKTIPIGEYESGLELLLEKLENVFFIVSLLIFKYGQPDLDCLYK